MTTDLKRAWLLPHLSLLAGLALSVAMSQAADPVSPAPPTDAEGNFSGKVTDTMTADRYTYLQVDTGGRKVWAATTHLAVANGDTVRVFGAMPMADFHSKTLNRDFKVIYFSGSIVVGTGDARGGDNAPVLPPGHPALPGQGSSLALPPNHPPVTGLPGPGPKVNLVGLAKADGGKTVQEIIAGRTQLAGQAVKVRGKVVKYNAMVMGKNWLHIQDNSGSADRKDNDLTITTNASAKLGDTVLVNGKVATDKDFGSGYKYAVILEDAQVTVE